MQTLSLCYLHNSLLHPAPTSAQDGLDPQQLALVVAVAVMVVVQLYVYMCIRVCVCVCVCVCVPVSAIYLSL